MIFEVDIRKQLMDTVFVNTKLLLSEPLSPGISGDKLSSLEKTLAN